MRLDDTQIPKGTESYERIKANLMALVGEMTKDAPMEFGAWSRRTNPKSNEVEVVNLAVEAIAHIYDCYGSWMEAASTDRVNFEIFSSAMMANNVLLQDNAFWQKGEFVIQPIMINAMCSWMAARADSSNPGHTPDEFYVRREFFVQVVGAVVFNATRSRDKTTRAMIGVRQAIGKIAP